MALPAQAKRTTDRLQGHATPDDHVMQCPQLLLSDPLFLSLSPEQQITATKHECSPRLLPVPTLVPNGNCLRPRGLPPCRNAASRGGPGANKPSDRLELCFLLLCASCCALSAFRLVPAGYHVAVLPLPLLSCLLLPLLVTRCGAAFLFLILPSAACAGPCTSAREEGKARFGYPLGY